MSVVQSNLPNRASATAKHRSLLDGSFRVGISLKGLHALIETISGLLLLKLSPQTINRYLVDILDQELSRNPHDFFAGHLLRFAEDLAGTGRPFASAYLISHGAVKLVLVIALLMNRLWAYPLMIVMLSVFIGYQTYRFVLTHSSMMMALSVFDLIVLILTWLEFREQRLLRRR
jgi:uncharacterized membrane protein